MSSERPTNPDNLRPSTTVPRVELPRDAAVPKLDYPTGEFLQDAIDRAAERAAKRAADYFREEAGQQNRRMDGYLQEHRREALARVRADETRERRFDLFMAEVRGDLGAIKQRLEEGEKRFTRNELEALIDRQRAGQVLETVTALNLRATSPEPGEGPGPLAGARVAVIDDEPSVRAAMGRVIEDAGGECFFAETVGEARALLDAAAPDVMVVDLVLRGGDDGMRLVRELRLGHGGVGVVIASGNVDAAVRDEARELDVAAVIHKPYSAAALVSAVAEARDAARGTRP